jgi:hypothetical protein
MNGVLWLILSLLAASRDAATHRFAFAQFRPEPRLHHSPAPPRLSDPRARRFRTVLREAAKEGPNFNGHYRVVSWGCGTNCIEWAVIDLAGGDVWMAPDPLVSCWFPDGAPDAKVPDWFALRINSSLLIQHECRSPSNRQTFDTTNYFAWKHGHPELLGSEPLGY